VSGPAPTARLDEAWLRSAAEQIAGRAERELEALVAVSSPSGDVHGAEEMCAVVSALLPPGVEVERLPCSSAGHAPDLLATLRGTGRARVVLIGHLDTVVSHAEHRPLVVEGDRLIGSGAVDMKGGVVLSLGVMRALAERRESFAELCLLAVNDEEWRTGGFDHGPRFAGFDAGLCFEAGELGPGGEEALVARRKAAATLRVDATGRAAHSGSAPERGRNALLALANAAQRVAALNAPQGPDRLTVVPTVSRAGDAFNVVPAEGELICDLRADSLEAMEPLLEALPAEIDEVRLDAALVRRWPGMDTRALVAQRLLGTASELLGRPIVASERGGASDASHVAAHVPLTVDGLGPRGGGAHSPREFVLLESLRSRAEVALAVTAAALAPAG
jgi:glutamate carboxypeptidase